jgi:hypothetical protein
MERVLLRTSTFDSSLFFILLQSQRFLNVNITEKYYGEILSPLGSKAAPACRTRYWAGHFKHLQPHGATPVTPKGDTHIWV